MLDGMEAKEHECERTNTDILRLFAQRLFYPTPPRILSLCVLRGSISEWTTRGHARATVSVPPPPASHLRTKREASGNPNKAYTYWHLCNTEEGSIAATALQTSATEADTNSVVVSVGGCFIVCPFGLAIGGHFLSVHTCKTCIHHARCRQTHLHTHTHTHTHTHAHLHRRSCL
jgi:hypothetical protein